MSPLQSKELRVDFEMEISIDSAGAGSGGPAPMGGRKEKALRKRRFLANSRRNRLTERGQTVRLKVDALPRRSGEASQIKREALKRSETRWGIENWTIWSNAPLIRFLALKRFKIRAIHCALDGVRNASNAN